VSSFNVEISVICEPCGADLDVDLNRHGVLEVKPCKECAEHAYEQGSKSGYAQAERDAEAAGSP